MRNQFSSTKQVLTEIPRHRAGAGSRATAPPKRVTVGAVRRGAAVVELAIVIPFLAVLLLGICELGQALRVETILTRASRNGCASGSRPGCGNADVLYEVRSALSAAGLPGAAATITILVNDQPGNVALARRNDKITVSVSIRTSQVTWTGSHIFVGRDSMRSNPTTMLKHG